MALPNETLRSFCLYVTHVDGDGHFLKISGQLDQQSSLMVESLFEAARENLEKGIGIVPPAAIHEGIICAAKYKDGIYYRAKVVSTASLSTGQVGVHFIDYGNKDIISLSTIRFLDSYDPMFLQLRGQATDYYLSRVIHPSGRWEEPLLLKLRSLLCYAEYPATIEAQTRTLPLISVQFKGNDLTTHLVSNRFGVSIPVTKQEVLLLQLAGESQQISNWQSFVNEPPSYTEHVPFLRNQQNFPANPASTMRIQANSPLPFNGAIPAASAISQRLLVNKAPRVTVNLRAPIRQPQLPPPFPPASLSTPPPSTPSSVQEGKPPSPKKTTTYKSRLLEVNSQHRVFVSYADEGPELFAVQLASDAHKLQEMMDEINRRPHSSLKEPPMIGTVCLGRMSLDRIISRAIVMNLSGSQCKLFFVDFGDTEMVSYYDIFDIPEEYVKPNVFAMRFCLSGIKQLEKGPYLNETFKNLVNGTMLTLRVVAPEGPPLIQYGELYLDSKNVLDLLLANMKDKLQFKWMEKLTLGSKASVLVSYVDSCVKFYVQLSEYIDELNAVMDAVKKHCESSSSPGELPAGSACCARFPDDGNWYRARIIHSQGKRVTVAYVDYGNEQEVDVSDLRTITPELIKLPAQAMKCALKGFENKVVETKTSNQLEMLALEKTLMAHIVGVLSTDTMLVSLIDDTVSPPLDVARRMNQLAQPRSSGEIKATTPVRKEAPDTFSSPEGSVPDDSRKKGFRREKSFKDERRPPRENNDDFAQRGGSFRNRDSNENFDRSGPGRHSEKFGRQDRGERRGGSRPWESAAPAPVSAANEEWDEPPAQPAPTSSNYVPPAFRHNRDRPDRDNKFNNRQDEREEKPAEDWGNRNTSERTDRRENRGERRDWNQKRDFRDNRTERGERGDRDRTRSNFTPRDRAERSFGSDGDKRSERSFKSQDSGRDRSGRAPPYKSRSNNTLVQYKELTDPLPLETQFTEPTVEPGAQHEVSVTWIISPENFYTQILSLQPQFLEMMHKIPELYKGVKSYTGMVPVGASVLARYPADGVLYRATIVSVQPFSKFIVRYVDFGNKQLVDAKDIWQLDEQLMALPKMAVHCSLLGVRPKDGEWKTNPEIDLCFNAPRYQCVFQDVVEGQHRVSLWNNGVSVADMLIEKQLAVMSEQQTAVTLKDEAIDLTIIVGQQILSRVTHVESFEKFYIQLDLEKAKLVENAIANFDANLLVSLAADSLTDGIHCTVKHEGKIFRAILNDVSDPANIQAVLPDYGNTITTSSENLMILPTELSVYYYQSLECCLNNYTEESTKLMSLEELKEKITGKELITYINNVDGIRLVATLYEKETGKKIAIFEPDPDAYDEVVPLCMRAVYNYNFGVGFITHLENLNEIYLQKSADSDKIALLLDEMFKFYEEGTPEPLTSFEADGLCVAKSSDGNWYRATIISAEESECKVQFSDYGNTETVTKDSIKKLDPKFFEPCALALVAGLGLVALQDDAVSKLTEWTTDKEVQITLAFGTDGWLASLHLDGVDLSMKLVNEKLATPQIIVEEQTKSDAVAEEPASLPAGCTQVYISHIDSPGHFWLQMADKVNKIEEIQAELQEHTASYADIENREMGTLCIAKYLANDQWYRAEILDSDSDITTVRFIDYGNTDVLDNQPGLLKAIPDRLKEIERYAIKSSVNAVPTGTGQWSEPASDYFTQLCGDLSSPVNALIVLKDVTTYVDIFVNEQNLTDKLVSEGHATRSEETECGDLPSCFASHVNTPSEFWIQLETATSDLQSMEAAMVDAENFPELSSKEEGVICAAKYPEDGAWYRAQVIVDGSEGTEVLFMDYGNASIATELRSLPDELKAKPALSRKCALQKPRDIKSWSRKSEIKFNDLAAEGATIFNVQFIASGDISIVELYLEGKSVTEELVSLCEEVPAAERPTPVGQDLHSNGKICHVNSLDEFYVHLDDAAADLGKVLDKLICSEDFEPASELKVGTVCAAFCAEDEQWYRAKILEFCDVGYHVQFIDYGNKGKCEDFRQLPEDISVLEPLAKCCRLAGLRNEGLLYDSAKNRLHDLAAEDTTFQIEFLDSTKEPSLVKLLLNDVDIMTVLSEVEAEIDMPSVSQKTKENINSQIESDQIGEKEQKDVTLDENIGSHCIVTERISSEPKLHSSSSDVVVDDATIEISREENDIKLEEKEPKIDSNNKITENEYLEAKLNCSSDNISVDEAAKSLVVRDIGGSMDYDHAVLEKKLSEANLPLKRVDDNAKDNTTEKESKNLEDNEPKDVLKQESSEVEAILTYDKTWKESIDMNTSQPDLDESIESNHTVIENKSFEAKLDCSSDNIAVDEEAKDNSTDTPEKDGASKTIENLHKTATSPEKDVSKESVNTNVEVTITGDTNSPAVNSDSKIP